MSNVSYAALRAVLALFTVATVLIACDKQSVSPTDATSSARVLADSTSADSTSAKNDSTCHHRNHADSTRHHHPDSLGHLPDSLRHGRPHHGHFPDSSGVKPPLDSTRHDSTHHDRGHRPGH